MHQLTVDHFDHLLVTHLTGDLTLPEAVSLRKELERIVTREKVKDIILDLRMVEEVDSSGLGVLVAMSTLARSHGKRIVLYQSPEIVLEALKQSSIDGFFPLLEDDADLLAVMPD
jgi:anti-sigma B factor antagonist